MKNCAYCGRENEDAAAQCHECGTELTEPAPAAQRADAGDGAGAEWLGASLRCIAATLLALTVYLLSFGPVSRYSATLVGQTTNSSANMTVVTRTVRYPGWVRAVYYPVFLMNSGSGLYGRYVQWWQTQQ